MERGKEYCFQAVIGGNVKGPGQFLQPAKSSQSKKGPQNKDKSRVELGKYGLKVKMKRMPNCKTFCKTLERG